MPKSSIFDRYETYDTSTGFGNPDQWRSAFNSALGKTTSLDEARSILGISKNASLAEIKQTYRKLAFLHHPDKTPNSEKFQEISNAFKIVTSNISKTQSPYSPQLLNEISEQELEFYLSSPLYCAQEKHDGRRRILHFENNSTTSINKKGLSTDCIPEFDLSCQKLANLTNRQEFTLDGEEVNTTFYNFDILTLNGEILTNSSYSSRIQLCQEAMSIQPVYTAYSEHDKRALYTYLKIHNKEGIVFKLLSGKHVAGYSNDQVKFKFYATASVIVIRQNIQNSVGIAVMDNNSLIPIGNVTCLGHSKPNIGDIIEVKYLYAYRGGSLYQPSLIGPRDDCYKTDCTLSKLKFKST